MLDIVAISQELADAQQKIVNYEYELLALRSTVEEMLKHNHQLKTRVIASNASVASLNEQKSKLIVKVAELENKVKDVAKLEAQLKRANSRLKKQKSQPLQEVDVCDESEESEPDQTAEAA